MKNGIKCQKMKTYRVLGIKSKQTNITMIIKADSKEEALTKFHHQEHTKIDEDYNSEYTELRADLFDVDLIDILNEQIDCGDC